MEPPPDLARLDAVIASEFAALCRTLSHETRVRLLLILRRGEQSVTSLTRQLRENQPTVSHHLALLRSAGLVGSRREGRSIIYFATCREADELAATRHVSVRLLTRGGGLDKS